MTGGALAATNTRAGDARLGARDLVVRYPGTDASSRPALVLDELVLEPGRSVALVGESGSGKTTALRALLGTVRATSGEIAFAGTSLHALRGREILRFRRSVQPIQQDVDGALDPRQSIGSAIAEGHRAGGGDRAASALVVTALLDEVGLPRDVARRHPHEVSGGQRQRAVIARALAVDPRILLLDEPTSGLDATVQVRILELIERLRRDRGLGILLVSHSLGVVARLCDETVVLYRGEVVERGATAELLHAPRMPYTAALRRSVPEIGVPFRRPWAASPDGPAAEAAGGCRFANRCPHARLDACAAPQALLAVEGTSDAAAGSAGSPSAGSPARLVRCGRTPELGVLDPLA